MPSRRSRALTGHGPALLLVLSVLASSCSKKEIVVTDPDGLEGSPSSSQLVVWPETPTSDSLFADLGAGGPSIDDTLISVSQVYDLGPRVVHGMIFDYTEASGFELFRRESGGFRPLLDFIIQPSKRYFGGHADAFRFHDTPGSPLFESYLARGVVDGTGPSNAPKTNVARITQATVSSDLAYTAPTGIPPDFRPMSDSLLFMSWDAVPSAAGYWVHIYQFISQGGLAVVQSGLPAPYYLDVTHDYLIAYLPASSTSYRWGDPIPAGGHLLTEKGLLNGQVYLVRVAAVDGEGQLISYTGASGSFGVIRAETSYEKFPLGAVVVQPRRGSIATAPAGAGIPTDNPRLTLFPAGIDAHRLR